MKTYILILIGLLFFQNILESMCDAYMFTSPSIGRVSGSKVGKSTVQNSPKTIIASSVSPGYNKSNATQCFVNAIKSAKKGDTVIIDCKAETDGVWNIEGRHPRWFDGRSGVDIVADDLTIIFEEGVTLKAIDSTYNDDSGLDMLLRLENISGWKIYGYGANFEMDNQALPEGENWHAIGIYDCKNILFEGLRVDGSGGDGIYVGTRSRSGQSENIRLKNMNFENHRRQGMTIISADDVLVENVKFNKTTGRPPTSGLDLEPNYGSQRLTRIKFRNVELAQNGYTGILFALSKFDIKSVPLEVEFDGIYVIDNWQEEGELNESYKKAAVVMGLGGGADNAVQGSVTFNDILIKDGKFDGLFTLKHHDAYNLRFENIVIENIGGAGASNAQNAIHTSRYNYNSPVPSVGNLIFDGLLVLENRDMPFWKMEGDKNDGWRLDDVIIDDALIVSPHTRNNGIYNTTNARQGNGTSLRYERVKAIPRNILTIKKKPS